MTQTPVLFPGETHHPAATATGRAPAPHAIANPAAARDAAAGHVHGGGADPLAGHEAAPHITYQAAVNEAARLLGLAALHLTQGDADKADGLSELAERWRVLAKFLKDHESTALPSLSGMELPPPPPAAPVQDDAEAQVAQRPAGDGPAAKTRPTGKRA